MKKVLTVILVGAGVPLFVSGVLVCIALSLRPGHDATMMFGIALVCVAFLAAIPLAIRALNKR